MSTIRAACPNCQAVCGIPQNLCGQNIRCPKCKQVFQAPAAAATVLPAEAEPRPPATPAQGADLDAGVCTKPSEAPLPPKEPMVNRRQPEGWVPRDRPGNRPLPIGLIVGVTLAALLLFGGLTVWLVLLLLQPAEENPVMAHQGPALPDPAVWQAEPPAVRPPLNPGPQNLPFVKVDPPIEVKKEPAPKPRPPAGWKDWGGGPAFEIKRCPIDKEQEERPLPGVVNDIVLGGGGRFVVVSLPDIRKIAIFDVNEAKVVKYLPMAEADAMLAAGMEKLFVCLPGANVVQRWSLRTFEREVTVASPVVGNLKAACMGWASQGPLLLISDRESRFVHPRTLRPLELQGTNGPVQPRLGPDARASGDGTVFTCMEGSGSVRVYIIREGIVTQHAGGTSSFISAPGADGSFICTMIGVYTPEMNEIYPKTNQNGLIVSPFVASKQGRMFFRIGQGGHDGPKNFNFFLYGHDRPIAVFPNFVGFDSQKNTYAEGAGRRSADRRYLLLPQAEVLVALPATNDRLLLRKFNVRELLEKSGVDYLVVTSAAPRQAIRGMIYRYDLTVLSKRGGLRYKVESGPPGMQITPQGRLTWAVPRDFGEANAGVILAVSDAAGQEAFHTFRIAITDKANGP